MIELSRFDKKEIVTAPITSNFSQFKKRKLFFKRKKVQDGWYEIKLDDEPKIIAPADEIQIMKALQKLPLIRGYSFGDEVVPLHFDSTNFKYGLTESISVYFMRTPLWSISKIRQWENAKWFFDGISVNTDLSCLIEVKARFDTGRDLMGLKGVSPELRYYFIITRLQSQNFRQVSDLNRLKISKEEKLKRIKAFQSTLAGRLEKTITDAGGHLNMFTKRGDNLIVDWSVGGTKFNSLIKADTLHIKELGFCASGEDKLHTMQSAVLIAKEYQENGSIHITRE